MIIAVQAAEVKETLMDPKSSSIKQPYYLIPSPTTQETVTLLVSGKNGSEFNKTAGFQHKFPGVLIYRCLFGQGIVMIQKNDLEGGAKEVKVAGIRPGVEVEVPAGYAHTLINTGKSYLVTVDNMPKEARFKDTTQVKERHGLAYYIVDKKGEIGFEENPNYKFHPQIGS